MKFSVISDIHCEHHRDLGYSACQKLIAQPDVCLIIAGDFFQISSSKDKNLEKRLNELSKKFAKVVYVFGNHEYYSTPLSVVAETKSRINDMFSGRVVVLDNDSTEFEGTKIHGTTLWFPKTAQSVNNTEMLNDFRLIESYSDWVFAANESARNFLRKTVRPKDIVVTHHLPSHQCVSPVNYGDPINCYYVSPCDDIIKMNQPSAWLHGHSHVTSFVKMHRTSIISNPHGYPRERNVEFSRNTRYGV